MQHSFEAPVYVLVAAKINKSLAYSASHLSRVPGAGALVRVPLGGRTVTGIVCDKSDTPEQHKNIRLKPVLETLPEQLSIPRQLLSLLQWCQRYYHAPIGQVIQAALPKSLLNGKPAEVKRERLWQTKLSSDSIEAVSALKQRELLQWLKDRGPSSPVDIIKAGFGRHLITSLNNRQLIERMDTGLDEEVSPHLQNQTVLKQPPKTLTQEQQLAVKRLCSAQHKQRFYLLNGVTGSGKTEVYLQAAELRLRSGGKVLVLVPEIGLIAQTAGRFKDRFNIEVLTYHSDSPESEKIQCWKKVQQAGPIVIVGTRSSIFLPFSDLSLIVVDEEQDLSYKQQQGFRYSARDLSVIRATEHNATLILGSATPSLESLNNADRGVLETLYLRKRIGERPLPEWQLCKPARRDSNSPLAETSLQAISDQLKQGNQVLVFINRRGFAPVLECSHCGWQAKCDACEATMTLHLNPRALICHRCDNRQAVAGNCPDCKSTRLRSQGSGTEKIERFLQSQFPTTSCLRIDRDSTQRKGSFSARLSELKQNKPAILIGTQMITKGHHLPGISLAVVVATDSALMSHDFRSLEHLAQSLTQVAGRAGRGNTAGKVLIETAEPGHPLFQALTTSSYHEYSAQLLAQRKCHSLPPYHFSALLHASCVDLGLLQQFMEHCRQQLASHKATNCGKIDFIGPMPSPVEKRSNRFRYQIQLYSGSRSQLHLAVAVIEHLVESTSGFGKIRFAIDIDPLSMD